MSAPREFTMKYNFKLVYTDIVYTLEISSHATLQELFDEACEKFKSHINYYIYYLDYVVAGQDKCELASAVGLHNLDQPIWYQFGEKWRQISFYVRPMNRNDDSFHRMDNYYVEPFNPETQELETQELETQELETQEPETNSGIRDVLGVILPPPPGLTRQVDREIFI